MSVKLGPSAGMEAARVARRARMRVRFILNVDCRIRFGDKVCLWGQEGGKESDGGRTRVMVMLGGNRGI